MAITFSTPTITMTGGKDTGTATSGTATTLIDTGKSWTVNAFSGRMVLIHTGTGATSLAYIVSNTATVLTVAGGFYKIDITNKTLSTVTPDNTSQYIIGFNAQDIKDADTAGGWGKVSKQGNNQFEFTADIDLGDGTTKSYFGSVKEVLSFSSGNTLPMLDIKAAGYFSAGAPQYGSKGSIIYDAKSIDATADTHTTLNCASSSFTYLLGNSEIIHTGDVTGTSHHLATFAASSNVAVLGGTEHKVYFTGGTQIKQQTNNFYCDGLALVDGVIGTSQSSSFVLIGAATPLLNLLLKGNASYGIQTSTTVGATTYTLTAPTFISNTFDMEFRGGHTVTLINPIWSANIQARSVAGSTGQINEKYTYDLIVKDGSGNLLTGVQCRLDDQFAANVFNAATSSGILAQQIINYRNYNKTVELSTSYTTTIYSPHTLKVRKYGFVFQSESVTMTSAIATTKSLLINSFVVASDATATAYTGIAINGSAKTITLSSAHTVQEIYDYSQAWADDSGNIQYDEPFTTSDGSNFVVPSAWILYPVSYLSMGGKRLTGAGKVSYSVPAAYTHSFGTVGLQFTVASATHYDFGASDFTGTVTLTNTSGGNVFVDLPAGVTYVNTGPNITVTTVSANISITGLANAVGASNRLQIINQTALSASAWAANTVYATGALVKRTTGIGSENTAGLYFRATTGGTSHATTEPTWNTTPGGTTTDGTVTWTTYKILYYDADPASTSHSSSYTDGNEFLDGETYEVRFAEMDAATSFKTYHTTGLVSSTGFTLAATMTSDDVYATNALNGSTYDTVFSPDYTNDYIVLDANTDFSGKGAYAYYCYLLTTSSGMYEFWDGVTALDAGNYRIETDTISLYFDESGGFVKQTDDVRFFRKDGARPAIDPTTGGNGIEINWRVPVSVVETGVSGLTGAESAQLMGLPSASTTATAVIEAGALTTGKFLALK